jgi:hypothetical protein
MTCVALNLAYVNPQLGFSRPERVHANQEHKTPTSSLLLGGHTLLSHVTLQNPILDKLGKLIS